MRSPPRDSTAAAGRSAFSRETNVNVSDTTFLPAVLRPAGQRPGRRPERSRSRNRHSADDELEATSTSSGPAPSPRRRGCSSSRRRRRRRLRRRPLGALRGQQQPRGRARRCRTERARATSATSDTAFYTNVWAQAAAQGISVLGRLGRQRRRGLRGFGGPDRSRAPGVTASARRPTPRAWGARSSRHEQPVDLLELDERPDDEEIRQGLRPRDDLERKRRGARRFGLLRREAARASSSRARPGRTSPAFPRTAPATCPTSPSPARPTRRTSSCRDTRPARAGSSPWAARRPRLLPSPASPRFSSQRAGDAPRQPEPAPLRRRSRAVRRWPALSASAPLAAGSPAFHDVTTGSNSVPGVTGYAAGPGYDAATGLGSVDAAALASALPAPAPASTDFTLGANPATPVLPAGGSVVVNLALYQIGTADADAVATVTVAGLPAGVTAEFRPGTPRTRRRASFREHRPQRSLFAPRVPPPARIASTSRRRPGRSSGASPCSSRWEAAPRRRRPVPSCRRRSSSTSTARPRRTTRRTSWP